MSIERAKHKTIPCIPDLQLLVNTAGEDAFAIGAPRTAAHPVGVALESEDLLALLTIPDFQRVVPATGDQTFAIWAPRTAMHVVRVPIEGENVLTRFGVPDLQPLVI